MAKRRKQRARAPERSDAPQPSATVGEAPAASRGGEWPARTRWIARAIVGLAAIATFARGVPSPLVATWDDGRFLIDFEPVQSVSLEHLRVIWTEVHFQAWHPLHLMGYWLDVPWAGPSGPVLHAVNLALWVLALFLALRVFERLGLGVAPAVIAVLLYGLHPAQVEAVTWATGRKEILALTFACLAWLTHLDADRYPSRAAWAEASGAARARWVLSSAVPALLYVLAAMSKTTVLPLPGVLFLGDVLLCGVPVRRALARQIPILVIGAAFAAVVIGIWQHYEMIRPDAGGARSGGRAGLVAATFTHHVTTAAWPASLSPVYPIDRRGDFGAAVWILPAAYALALALAWRAKARRALFALSATGVLLLPVLNFVPVYFQFQDRYLSLPLLPVAFGAGALLDRLSSGSAAARRAALALGAVLVAVLAARTVDYQRAWSSDLALWRHATSTHPDAFYAWLKLGEHLRDEGELDGSIAAYARGVEAAPDLKLSHSAYFNAVAMRDEARADLAARSLAFTERYHAALDDPDALRLLAGDMVEAGYREAVTLALGRSFDLAPIDDDRLARAALVQLETGHEWLARFYVSRMSAAPGDPRLRGLRAR